MPANDFLPNRVLDNPHLGFSSVRLLAERARYRWAEWDGTVIAPE